MNDALYINTKGSCVEHSTDAPVFAIKYMERGYYPIYTRATAEDLNKDDVTPAIQESAICASMAGWTAPGARDAVRMFAARESAAVQAQQVAA